LNTLEILDKPSFNKESTLMKRIIFSILALVTISTSAFAAENCKLKVYTTSPYASVVVHFLKFNNYSIDQCKNLCSSKSLLQAEVPPYEIILRCGMKFINEDGTTTKTSYNHLFQ